MSRGGGRRQAAAAHPQNVYDAVALVALVLAVEGEAREVVEVMALVLRGAGGEGGQWCVGGSGRERNDL